MEESLPIFQDEKGEWWFWGLDNLIGPLFTRDSAVRVYENYRAYVIDAPACHHPGPSGLKESAE